MNPRNPAAVFALAAMLSFVSAPRAIAATTLDHPSIKATVDLGEATFHWRFRTAPGSDGGNVTIQMFIQNLDTREYVTISPRDAAGAPVTLALVPDGSDNAGSFTVTLPVGRYGAGKAVLFAADSNFSKTVAAFGLPSMDITVKTDSKRVAAPILIADSHAVQAPGADGKLHVPYVVKFPSGFASPGNGFWVMVKGKGVFKQEFVNQSLAQRRAQGTDEYEQISGELVVDMPTEPGVYNANLGLFDGNWKMDQWVYPGVDFGVGDWVVRADPARYPSIARAISSGKAPFFLGGNFGNAIASIGTAANDSPIYYKLLHASAGLTVLRENFDPRRYEAEDLYRKEVAQIAENMWSAGVVPCLSPQDMPPGTSRDVRAAKLEAVDKRLAEDFAGKPVIIDVLNEPHEYESWEQWKPVAVRLARAVKTIDPKAFVVVESEGFAEDMSGASRSPIGEGLVDLYGWHSYHASVAELRKKAGHGIPVWLEEYHNPSSAFHSALTAIPNLKGVAAWAWTTPGQDSLPLVKSVDGAQLRLTPDGEKIAGYYRRWRDGQKISADDEVSAPASASFQPAKEIRSEGAPPARPGLTVEQVREIARQVYREMSAKSAKQGKK